MEALWPWLVVAGMGALHGAHPANGWIWMAARGAGARSRARPWWSLWPLALGHVLANGVTVYAVSRGVLPAGPWTQRIAGLGLLVVAATGLVRMQGQVAGATTAGTALSAALSSALMATSHGAGLMLVPALLPLCMSALPAREITASGSLWLALAAVGLHLAAMLLAAGGLARLVQVGQRRLHGWSVGTPALWCSLVLAVTGVGLVVMA
ncbi:MAG TPA: hypothetical protein VD865_16265 [Stenotrophomonas sp.]|nr:hypothetical protein [Stenotrophomonas sp.]